MIHPWWNLEKTGAEPIIEMGKTESRKRKSNFCFPDFNFLLFQIGDDEHLKPSDIDSVRFYSVIPECFCRGSRITSFHHQAGKGHCPAAGFYCGLSLTVIHRPKIINSASTKIIITPRADA